MKKTLGWLILGLFAANAANATIGDSGALNPSVAQIKSHVKLTQLEKKILLKVQNGVDVNNPAINAITPLIVNQVNGSLCTGILLNKDTVLTAAHCVLDMSAKANGQSYVSKNVTPVTYANNGEQYYSVVVLFNKDLNKPLDFNTMTTDANGTASVIGADDIYVHANAFKGAQVVAGGGLQVTDLDDVNDLAVLKLAKPVSPGYFTAFPTLPKYASTQPVNNYGNKVLTIAGYGPNGVDKAYSIDENGKHQKDANGNDIIVNYFGVLVAGQGTIKGASDKQSLIAVAGTSYDAATDRLGFVSICQGDSGGPDYLIDDSGAVSIVGVHSFGAAQECGTLDSPGKSMNVFYGPYNTWIKNIINGSPAEYIK